jgi:O-antigen/teichoic acid export membrane protein
MAGIVRNTFVNLTAHAVNGVVSLMLAPVLVLAYGIDKYGLIVLARNLLPGGFVSLFDFGLPESVTRYTSSAVAAEQTEKAQHLVVSALAIAGLAAIVLAVLIVASGHYLIEIVFRVPDELAGSFRLALWASAAALLLQFPGFILKAALEGLERFDVVRTAEISGTVGYAAAAAAIALADIDYHWVIIAFVVASSARLLYFAFYLALRKPAGFDLRRGRWRSAELGPALRHAFAFFQGKILSVAFNYAPSMVISALAGPAATGIYDLVMRIPRMVKVLCGMLGSPLLPFASRSEVHAQTAQIERVLYSGTMLALLLVVPIASAVAVLAPDVLGAWLGPQFRHLGPWLALAMAWPAVIGWNTIGQSMVIASPVAVRRSNLISLIQVSVFYAVSLLWPANDLSLGFVAGTVVCVLVAAPLQIWLLVSHYRLSLARYLAPLAKVLVTGALLFALVHALGLDAPRDNLAWLSVRLAAWCIAYWALLYFFVLSAAERQEIHHVVQRLASVLSVRRVVGR